LTFLIFDFYFRLQNYAKVTHYNKRVKIFLNKMQKKFGWKKEICTFVAEI